MHQLDIWGNPLPVIDPRGFYARIIVGGEVSELGPYPTASDAIDASCFFPAGAEYEIVRRDHSDAGVLTDNIEGRFGAGKRY